MYKMSPVSLDVLGVNTGRWNLRSLFVLLLMMSSWTPDQARAADATDFCADSGQSDPCFLLRQEPASLSGGLSDCETLSGQLAVPTSSDQSAMFATKASSEDFDSVWLGGTVTSGEWRLTRQLHDRVAEDLFEWPANSPDNGPCAFADPSLGWVPSSDACYQLRPYICEFTRPVTGCPGTMSEFLGIKCVTVNTAAKSWYDAYSACSGQSGKLLILDEATTNGIATFLNTSQHSEVELWTGISRYLFRWHNDDEYVYSHWAPDQPPADIPPGEQRCVAGRAADGRWTSRDCTSPTAYVCRLTSFTTPTTKPATTPGATDVTRGTDPPVMGATDPPIMGATRPTDNTTTAAGLTDREKYIIGGSAGGAALFVIIIAIIMACCCKRKYQEKLRASQTAAVLDDYLRQGEDEPATPEPYVNVGFNSPDVVHIPRPRLDDRHEADGRARNLPKTDNRRFMPELYLHGSPGNDGDSTPREYDRSKNHYQNSRFDPVGSNSSLQRREQRPQQYDNGSTPSLTPSTDRAYQFVRNDHPEYESVVNELHVHTGYPPR